MVVEVGSKPKLFLTLVGQCLKLAQWEFGSDNFHKIKITLIVHMLDLGIITSSSMNY